MRIIRISKRLALAFDLEWRQRDTISNSEHSQIQAWRREGFAQAASYRHPGGAVFGLVRPDGSKVKPKETSTLMAGAAVIASHPSMRAATGIVEIAVADSGEETLVILVGLRGGVVVLDRLVQADEVTALRNSFVRDHLPPGTKLESWGHVHSTPAPEHDFPFENLTPRRGGGRPAPIGPLRSSRMPTILLGITSLAIVGVGAMYGYRAFEEREAKLAKDLEYARNTPAAIYTQEVARWLQRDVYFVAPAVETVREYFAPLTWVLMHEGWTLTTATCDPASNDCLLRYAREDGRIDEFRSHAPKELKDIRLVDFSTVEAHVEVPFEKAKLDRSTWPKSEDFRLAVTSHWQRLDLIGWQADLSRPVQQAVPHVFTVEQRKAVADLPQAVYGYVIAINEQPWYFANEDPDSPISAARIGAQTELQGPITLKFTGQEILFTLKATGYVQ